jgi:cyclic pyranopterin phosphate synthase
VSKLSHVDAGGNARMVDVSGKAATRRRAVAAGLLVVQHSHREALANLPKGDAISVAEVAGVMAAKRTSDLIPLCHPVSLSHVEVAIRLTSEGLEITAAASTDAQTGVEMEAYTAVVVAGITLIDMLKGVDANLVLTNVKLLEKTGGKADWRRSES